MQEKWKLPFRVASTARLLYGLGCILAPQQVAGRLAPTVRGADSRMNLRGFGGAQSAIALYTFSLATTPERARDALRLNALVDAFDAGVSMLEIRDRGRIDQVAAGGVLVNVLGLACWTSAALALRASATRPAL
jgi:hypothetical protein